MIDRSQLQKSARLSVFGAGAWGTALAIHFAAYMKTTLWSMDSKQVAEMRAKRVNSTFFPGYRLPDSLIVTDDIDAALAADLIVVAVPTAALASLFDRLEGRVRQPVVLANKGFIAADGTTPRLPFDYVESRLNGDPDSPVGILSGPSFAQELAEGKPTAVTLAFADDGQAVAVRRILHTPPMRVYSTTDRVGVTVGGAVKNALAIATGICDGIELGSNARAALITRGLAEIIRFGVAIGAKAETLAGLAGIGDVILTTTGDLSRNRRVGLMLAKGEPLDRILTNLGHVAEGVETARVLSRWAETIGVDMPICSSVRRILCGEISPASALKALLNRNPKSERLTVTIETSAI